MAQKKQIQDAKQLEDDTTDNLGWMSKWFDRSSCLPKQDDSTSSATNQPGTSFEHQKSSLGSWPKSETSSDEEERGGCDCPNNKEIIKDILGVLKTSRKQIRSIMHYDKKIILQIKKFHEEKGKLNTYLQERNALLNNIYDEMNEKVSYLQETIAETENIKKKKAKENSFKIFLEKCLPQACPMLTPIMLRNEELNDVDDDDE